MGSGLGLGLGLGLYLMNARKFSLSTRFLWTTLPSRFRWTSLGGRALGERPGEPCGSPRWPILLFAESKTLRGLATDCAWHARSCASIRSSAKERPHRLQRTWAGLGLGLG